VPVLQVKENCQDKENHHAGQDALLIHERGELSAAPPALPAGNGTSQGK
jgi:hypothetical protein